MYCFAKNKILKDSFKKNKGKLSVVFFFFYWISVYFCIKRKVVFYISYLEHGEYMFVCVFPNNLYFVIVHSKSMCSEKQSKIGLIFCLVRLAKCILWFELNRLNELSYLNSIIPELPVYKLHETKPRSLGITLVTTR
jgi:hypothetical protein